MPLYEFECDECKETIEVIQHFDDPPPDHCEKPMKRVFGGNRVAFDLKGECWAKDGYTKKSNEQKNL